jgi:acid phosphatase
VCATRCKPTLPCLLAATLAIACSAGADSVVLGKSAAPRPAEEREAAALPPGTHEMLNAALWQQTSAEYEAVARQAYRVARLNLDLALEDPEWSAVPAPAIDPAQLPPAVMLDLDETVFDNSRYEARIILDYGKFSSQTFGQWCEEAAADAVPGSTEFLRYADSRNVTIIYFSARVEKLRACTLRNLERLELPVGDPATTLLLRRSDGKEGHRRDVAKRYRVLLVLGDNLDDFVEGSQASAAERRRTAQQHADYWGSRWIILPNAMYGHWEATFFDFDYGLPRSKLVERKLRGLRR